MISKNELGEILKIEVNSASLTYQNHDNDNGFLSCDIDDMVMELNDRYSNIEPVGICRNTPFPCNALLGGDTYWCHFTEQLWCSLLSDVYGRKEAKDIVYGNINDALSDLNDTLKEQIDRLEAYDNR